jgi:hypothetical protein
VYLLHLACDRSKVGAWRCLDTRIYLRGSIGHMVRRVRLAPSGASGSHDADPAMLPPLAVVAAELSAAAPPGHPFVSGVGMIKLDLPLLDGSTLGFVAR